MKKLYFIRHGEAFNNTLHVWGGRSDHSLTELGREQAEVAAKQAKHDGMSFDLMLVSPLARAQETADIIESVLPIPRREINDLLIERDFGDLENTPTDKYFEAHTYKDIDSVPGAEKVEHLQARAKQLLDNIKALPEDNILLVSHSAFGRAFIRCVQNKPWSDEYNQPVLSLPHAEIIELI